MRVLLSSLLVLTFVATACVAPNPTLGVPFVAISTDTIIKPTTSTDTIYTEVDEEASFPGGDKAWQRHLIQKMRYPQKAQDENIQGKVELQYVVETDGSVTNIRVLDGPMELRQEAVGMFEITPNWLPAKKNGAIVRSLKKRPIVFRLG